MEYESNTRSRHKKMTKKSKHNWIKTSCHGQQYEFHYTNQHNCQGLNPYSTINKNICQESDDQNVDDRNLVNNVFNNYRYQIMVQEIPLYTIKNIDIFLLNSQSFEVMSISQNQNDYTYINRFCPISRMSTILSTFPFHFHSSKAPSIK